MNFRKLGVLLALVPGLCGVAGCSSAEEGKQQLSIECETLKETLGGAGNTVTARLYPRDVVDMLGKCEPERQELLRLFVSYHEFRENRDYPNSMATADQGASNYNDSVRQLELLLSELRKHEEAEFVPLLRYMVRQIADVAFAWTALEIAARLHPESYASYESVTQPDSESRRAWKMTKERWLKK